MSEETMNDNRKEEEYTVMAWVTVGGRINVKAYSQQDAEDMVESMIDEDEVDLVPLFWVFFPDAREVLHEAKAFNGKNSAIPISYDHLLNSRRFNGYVFREENIQGDRAVSEYINNNALMQLLESDRIKEKVRDFEQDMWSY